MGEEKNKEFAICFLFSFPLCLYIFYDMYINNIFIGFLLLLSISLNLVKQYKNIFFIYLPKNGWMSARGPFLSLVPRNGMSNLCCLGVRGVFFLNFNHSFQKAP
jgi:hypothetical protein